MTDDLQSWKDCLYRAEVACGQGLIDEDQIQSYAKHLAETYKIPVED